MNTRTSGGLAGRLSVMLVGLLAAACVAAGEVVIETWGVGERASHPQTVKIVEAERGAAVIQIDLSALLPQRPEIYRARLLALRAPITGADEEAVVKVEIFPLTRPFVAGGKPALGPRPLKLIAPWYDCFDATEQVRACMPKKSNCELYVKAFPKWQRESTALEVTFEGKPTGKLPPAVTGLRVFHRAGQTFITWKETRLPAAGGQAEDPFGDKPVTLAQLRQKQQEMAERARVRYRVYRHSRPIDKKSLSEAELLAEVAPFSGYNVRGVCLNRLIYQHQLRAVDDAVFARKIARGPFGGYHPQMPAMGEVVVGRLAIEDGKPLPPGAGLYVHHPAQVGKAYYAVVASVDGSANTSRLDGGASLAEPVAEQVGGGAPVFQCVEDLKVFYDYPGQRRRYVQWCGGPQAHRTASGAAAAPLANLPNQYYNWGVYLPARALPVRGKQAGVPPAAEGKQPLALGIFFHDSQGLYLKPRWPHPKDMILISPNDAPWPSYGYGYHESLGTLRSFGEAAVHDYTARRVDAFVEWVRGSFRIDENRMSCHGQGTLGGTAALHYGLRDAEKFALIVTGYFDADPQSTPALVQIDRNRRRTHLRGLEAVWGKKEWDLKNAEGASIWKDRDMVEFVKGDSKVSLPFLSLGTGSQHSTWPQETALMKALWQAKQPFWTDFTWGGQAPRFGPLYVRRDRLMLAVAPDPASLPKLRWYNSDRWQKASMGYWGGGAINTGTSWKIDDIVDTADRLEVTASAGGDVTIRNAQAFKLKAGEKVRWRVKTGRRDEPGGQAAADENGLLTIRANIRGRLIVTRGGADEAPKETSRQEGEQK